uniref:Prolyl 4-hydroxylase alpha subunit n=1 Tax=Cyanothece sp. (strain PCC 7425 / ATCC 29141) TaxID=395961 RepID=B8HX71_CYAP4
MDYCSFIEQLPELYYHWGEEFQKPKDERFQQLLDQINGFTSASVLQLLNFAVSCLKPNEVYCELGCGSGAHLIGALLNHDVLAYAVVGAPVPERPNLELETLHNLNRFDLQEQVCIWEGGVQDFFLSLRELDSSDKIGVLFCNGFSDYRTQLLALLSARPFLADGALLILSDRNWSAIHQASWDFMVTHPECQLLLDLPTPISGHRTFWNGLQILLWTGNSTLLPDLNHYEQMSQQNIIRADPLQLEFTPQPPLLFAPEVVQFENFLSPEDLEKVRDFVRLQQEHFLDSALMGNRQNVQTQVRQSKLLYLEDFPEFKAWFQRFLLAKLPAALQQLQHPEFMVSGMEMQLTLHGDGCYYGIHPDTTFTEVAKVARREITFVYYFCLEPGGFSGGELRMYPTQICDRQGFTSADFKVIEPLHNSLIFFNSRCYHEVMPVVCPGNRFDQGRFTINGWIYP